MRVIIEVTVRRPEWLYEAALERSTEEGIDPEQFGLKNEDGEIDEASCLQMLLDPGHLPGCEVEGSEVES